MTESAPIRKVIEWPQKGSARRFPAAGGWYVVEERAGRGYTPIAGPFKTQGEAEAKLIRPDG